MQAEWKNLKLENLNSDEYGVSDTIYLLIRDKELCLNEVLYRPFYLPFLATVSYILYSLHRWKI